MPQAGIRIATTCYAEYTMSDPANAPAMPADAGAAPKVCLDYTQAELDAGYDQKSG